MIVRTSCRVCLFAGLLALSACGQDSQTAPPTPIAMSEELLGHFCQMIVLEHPGPKAQIHFAGQPAPLFFSQVRDGVAYFKSPERDYEITAFYVNDMEQAESWEKPGTENWLDARNAHFVVGASVRGGMGAPELVPFGTEAAAREFSDRKGGSVVSLDEIPDDAVFGIVEVSAIGEEPGT